MKESVIMRIEFPDKDPDEWELFASFLEPVSVSGAKITNSNVEVLVPWFHEFRITNMLNECDTVYYDKSFPDDKTFWIKSRKDDGTRSDRDLLFARNVFETLADVCEFSVMYGLARTLKKALTFLSYFVQFQSDIFDLECMSRLISLLQYEECRSYLWITVKDMYLPEVQKVEDPVSLLSKDLFAPLLLAGMEKNALEDLLVIARR